MIMGNAVPPSRRIPAPHSRSAETSSGRRERCCRVLSLAAISKGEPTETMTPPTSSESTQRAAPGVRLTVPFSPEHGFWGTEDRPPRPIARDSVSGLPIYNLYRATRAAASAELDSLDAVLIDLQDVGARYYTYIATAVLLMEQATRHGKPVVALDRPDPLGGVAVQGNVRERPA